MTLQDIKEADAIILGAPGRQGGMCGEMRLFLDSLAPLQVEKNRNSAGALKVCNCLGQTLSAIAMDNSICSAGSPCRRQMP